MKILFYIVIFLAFMSAVYLAYRGVQYVTEEQPIACTTEAMICPDGSSVGRTGPNCEFAPCPKVEAPKQEIPADVVGQIAAKADLIKLDTPKPYELITSPLTITGEARGTWYFEGSFPIVLVDWDGKIIAEGHATADGDWMTEDFVPFTATLEFEKPQYGANGALILRKDNPSGLPENDDALEVPIRYAEEELISI